MVVGSGTSEKTFLVHKDLIVKHSEYFVSALKGCWREGREHKVTLSEDNVEAFEIFAQFIYTGKIYIIKEGDHQERPGQHKGDRRVIKRSTNTIKHSEMLGI